MKRALFLVARQMAAAPGRSSRHHYVRAVPGASAPGSRKAAATDARTTVSAPRRGRRCAISSAHAASIVGQEVPRADFYERERPPAGTLLPVALSSRALDPDVFVAWDFHGWITTSLRK